MLPFAGPQGSSFRSRLNSSHHTYFCIQILFIYSFINCFSNCKCKPRVNQRFSSMLIIASDNWCNWKVCLIFCIFLFVFWVKFNQSTCQLSFETQKTNSRSSNRVRYMLLKPRWTKASFDKQFVLKFLGNGKYKYTLPLEINKLHALPVVLKFQYLPMPCADLGFFEQTSFW